MHDPSLENGLIDRKQLAAKAEPRLAVFRYTEGVYNTLRHDSSLRCLSPVNCE